MHYSQEVKAKLIERALRGGSTQDVLARVSAIRVSRVGRFSPSGVSRHHMSTIRATVRTIASAYAALSRPTS
jgi:hypothetical protein